MCLRSLQGSDWIQLKYIQYPVFSDRNVSLYFRLHVLPRCPSSSVNFHDSRFNLPSIFFPGVPSPCPSCPSFVERHPHSIHPLSHTIPFVGMVFCRFITYWRYLPSRYSSSRSPDWTGVLEGLPSPLRSQCWTCAAAGTLRCSSGLLRVLPL